MAKDHSLSVWIGIVLLLSLAGCQFGAQPTTAPTTHARVAPGGVYPPPIELGQFDTTTTPESATPQGVGSTAYPPPPEETESVQHVINEIYDLTFFNRQAGWLVGSQCSPEGMCLLGVRVTQDGGKTWLPSPAPGGGQSWRLRGVGRPLARHIRFATQQDGWLYGPGFFASHDGGFTWSDQTGSRQVLAVEVYQGNTWIIQRECAGSEMCRYSLLTSTDHGFTWSEPAQLPNLPSENVELIRYGQNVAWLLSAGAPEFSLNHYLAVTYDAGLTWRELPVPCAKEETFQPHPSTSGGLDIWIICTHPPEESRQEKILSHSTDGGATWARIQSLMPEGILNDFVMVSPQKGFTGIAPFSLLATSDAGHSWSATLGEEDFPSEPSIQVRAESWQIYFFDQQNGWASMRSTLFETNDGGRTWKSSAIQ